MKEYFESKGWLTRYARAEDSRGMWQQYVDEVEEDFRLASAESDRIKAMTNEKYGPGTVKYGSEIKQPEIKTPQAVFEFGQRHPAATGGLIDDALDAYNYYLKTRKSRPSKKRYKEIPFTEFFEIYGKENFAEGGRTGYATKGFVTGGGPGTGSAVEANVNVKKVKSALNNIKKQINNKSYFEWSEKSDWYKKLQKDLGGKAEGLGMNREYTNKLINKVVNENFPGSYHGKNAIKNLRQDMVVNGFVEYLKDNKEFDGGEKFLKSLEKFEGVGDHKYQNINTAWKDWIAGDFEVEGVDRTQLQKELKARGIDYSKIDDWSANASQKRGLKKKAAIEFLDNQNNKFPNRSFEEIQKLYKGKFPDRNIYMDVNTLTDIKRTGIYKSGDSTTSNYKSVKKGNRANWLKESYGKQFQGNYSKLIKAADQLEAAGEFKKAKRISDAADKFFGPNGIITKAKGEGEHALARTFDLLNPDRQLAINSLVSGNLNQFKKNFFDVPVKRFFDEYNNPETTAARRKELKTLIEGRKSTLNSLTGGQKKGIVAGDIVKFEYGVDKITPSSSVEAIDTLFKEGKFNIDDYIAKGTAYGDAFKVAGEEANIFTKTGDIKKKYSKPINENKLKEIEKYITDRTGKVKPPMFSSGFAGAYEMLSDDLKNIVNSEGFKKFANSKTAKGLSTIARTPGKFFGLGDVLLGYLDYTNNKPMMSEAKAYQSMLQAMSFNVYRGGDKQNLKEIKEKFIANGGDGNIFDQVVTLNKQNADILQTVEKTKKNYTKNLENEKASGNIIGNVGLKYQVDLPTASEQLKLDLNSIKSKAENMEKNFNIYKETYTGEDLTKPSKDLKRAAFDLLEEEQIKNYPSTYDQVNTGSGPVAEQIYNSILTKDSYKKLLPQNIPSTVNQLLGLNFKPVTEKEKEAALIQEMKKNAPQELYRYNKEFRGMDPDEPMNIEETANFMNKNKKAIGFAEGGLAGLMKKYYD